MEYQKDNENEKGNSKGQDGMKNIVNPSFFNGRYGTATLSLLFKSKKLLTAMHMVTEYMPEREPMRQALRSTALEILMVASEGLLLTQVEKSELYTELEHIAGQAHSLLSVATTVGMISQMNGEILMQAYAKFVEDVRAESGVNIASSFQLDKYGKSSLSGFTLAPDFFNDDEVKEEKKTAEIKDFPKGHENTKRHDISMSFRKETAFPKEKKDEIKKKASKSDIGLRIARRNTILEIIKDKKDEKGHQTGVTIKDIVSLIKDVSEKTIQRELLSLVAQGVLKKEGDKRWSRYTIAS